ncbi:HNH endonuclease [Aquimarina sp. Aq78]|uniref:HNH endonuclease n=1 Tax=Aquimarina sp. Aq78 TaxID=1191889 RepID=UPI000D0F35AE|nr:HNH endonuclease [Aquimarina sp. Aq78]
MIAIHENKVKAVQAIFSKDIKNQREKAIEKLNVLNNKIIDISDKAYLESVILLFEENTDILIWDSDKINRSKDILGNVPMITKVYRNRISKQVKSPIKNAILTALGYKLLRSSFYPKYFKEVGIKSCVYCNSQLSITAVKSKNVYSAKFDVDHYHSKDDYPFLSINLFNLYPACSSCNRAKSNDVIEFELYTKDESKTVKSNYNFKLSPYAKSKYLTTRESKDIDFTFNEPNYNLVGAKKFNDVFHIKGIYETQDDLIEELIIKSQIYNKSYLKTLKSNFTKLNLHPELFKRTLVGNYTEDKDIHKRPMSKLVMDIAKDLNLI